VPAGCARRSLVRSAGSAGDGVPPAAAADPESELAASRHVFSVPAGPLLSAAAPVVENPALVLPPAA
jgi:hypothetical protein